VAADGLHTAAAWGVRQFAAEVQVIGAERLPLSGPVIVAANHPGITDTLAIFAALPRPDLHTVAAVRPFLAALDNVTERLILVDEAANAHLGVVRSVTQHLRRGGCVLTFPAGRIEPDPAVLPGATASLAQWSDSLGLFARLAPAAQIVPLLVSGVFSPHAQPAGAPAPPPSRSRTFCRHAASGRAAPLPCARDGGLGPIAACRRSAYICQFGGR
jgi:putative hemolysin